MTESLRSKPTDANLGRLAMFLTYDDPTSLAARLQIFQGNVEADRAALSSHNNSHRRLMILFRWRASHCSSTMFDLLELLTATKDYQKHDLEKHISSEPECQIYGQFFSKQHYDFLLHIITLFLYDSLAPC